MDDVATGALMFLLFLIGLQLRNAGLSLRKLLMNRQGLGIALALVASSLVAGLALIPVLQVPWHQAWRWRRVSAGIPCPALSLAMPWVRPGVA